MLRWRISELVCYFFATISVYFAAIEFACGRQPFHLDGEFLLGLSVSSLYILFCLPSKIKLAKGDSIHSLE